MHRIGDLTLDATRVNAVMNRAVNVGNIVWWRFEETRLLLTFFSPCRRCRCYAEGRPQGHQCRDLD
jgi:hypothetical protein